MMQDDTNTNESPAIRFREARKKAGLTQQQAADILKTNRRTILRYESGQTRHIRGITTEKLAEAVSTDANYILTGISASGIPLAQN